MVVVSRKWCVVSDDHRKISLAKECGCMDKAILAMLVTIIVGFVSCGIFASWINAQEFGIILAIAVMGAFIIFFNEKKK